MKKKRQKARLHFFIHFNIREINVNSTKLVGLEIIWLEYYHFKMAHITGNIPTLEINLYR
jgi:hypothetical protein